MDDPSITEHRDWQSRQKLLINSLHELALQLWKKGLNGVLHRHDDCKKVQHHQRVEEVLEIRHYYGKPELLSESDRDFCNSHLNQNLHLTPTNRRR